MVGLGSKGIWGRRDVLRAAGSLTVAALATRAARVFADAPAPPAAAPAAGKLSPEQEKQLAAAKFVYISSTRKDGSLGRPAEIWFAVMDGAVWVASSPDSWRAKRIRWGRPQAKIAVGSPEGPSLRTTGAFVKDPALYEQFCDQLAVKYASGWPRWEKSFREGLVSGERVLIRYTPVAV
jgi:hypothetical protein